MSTARRLIRWAIYVCTIIVVIESLVATTASHWPLSAGVNSGCVPSSVSRTYVVIFSWCVVIDAPTSISSHFRRMRFSWRVSRCASIKCTDLNQCNFFRYNRDFIVRSDYAKYAYKMRDFPHLYNSRFITFKNDNRYFIL